MKPLPDVEQVLQLHDEIIRKWGGSAGLRDMGLLEGALSRPLQGLADGTEFFPTVPLKAAALFHGVIKGHAFVDGNKRTAAMLTQIYIEDCGYDLSCSDEVFEEFTVAVAEGSHDIEAIGRTFAGWMVARKSG